MNPIALQTLQLMLSILATEKEGISKEMRDNASKVIKNLMTPILKDSDEMYKAYSDIKLVSQ